MEGNRCRRRPDAAARGFERVLTEWDSELFGVDVHLRTITRDGWVCTTYQSGYSHDGTEGELYDLADGSAAAASPWTIRLRRRSAATCSPTCGTTSRRCTHRDYGSKRPSETPPTPPLDRAHPLTATPLH